MDLFDFYSVLPDSINAETFSYYLVNTILNVIFSIGVLFASFLILNTYDKSKLSQYFKSNYKYAKNVQYFIYGLLVSLFSLWYVYMEHIHWTYTIFIFAAISFAFFYNISFYFGFLPLSIASVVLIYFSHITGVEIDHSSIYYLILNLIILVNATVISYSSKWLKWKNNTIFILSNIFIITLSLAITYPITFSQSITSISNYEMFVFGINYIFYFIVSFSSFSLFKIVMRFINKTEILSKKVVFKNDFILQKFANDQLKEFIRTNKIDCAAIMKIDVLGLDLVTTEYGSSYASNIKDDAVAIIKEKLSALKSIFYMQANDTEYFCMIKLDQTPSSTLPLINGNNRLFRESDDILKFIERKIKDAKNEIKQKGMKDVKIASFCSLYGVETNDINQINSVLSQCQRDSIVALNDIIYIKLDASLNVGRKTKDKILSEFGMFSPTDITVKITKENKNKNNFYHIDAISIKPFLTTKEEIWSATENKTIYSALVCHTSAKAIKEFINLKLNKKGNILLIDYPSYLLSQKEFNLFELTSRISSYGLKNGEFYINVILDQDRIDDIFIDNLNKLKNNGIELTFDYVPKNTNKQMIKKIKELNPKQIYWR